jgi:hypothetical protein
MSEKKEKKYTTVQIKKDIRPLLKLISQKNKRSMSKQIEWLVQLEAQRLGIEIETKKREKNG